MGVLSFRPGTTRHISLSPSANRGKTKSQYGLKAEVEVMPVGSNHLSAV